jgi:hypothetical protein
MLPSFLESFCAIVNASARPLEDIFAIGALVHILKASPPANVVDKRSRKVRLLVFHVRHQLVETLPTRDIQAAPTVIRVRLNDIHTVRVGILTDHLSLVFRGILLVLGGHAHVLRAQHFVPARLLHLVAITCPSHGTSPDGPADKYVS